MKNSQYVNQANVSVSDLIRIICNEVLNGGAEVIPVTILSMHVEFAKVFVKTIQQTIDQYEESIEKQKETMHTDKILS